MAEGLSGLGRVRHTAPVTHSDVESVHRLTDTRNIGHRALMVAEEEGGTDGQQSECDDGEHVEGEDRNGMVKVLGDEVVFRDLTSKGED